MSELPAIDEIPADTKNWTVVLENGCAECGFMPGYTYEDNERRILSLVAPVRAAFENSALTQRPDKNRWSPLEYLVHISEVCEVMVQITPLWMRPGRKNTANFSTTRWTTLLPVNST